MAVRKPHHGPAPKVRPLLLDRAVKARPVRVSRRRKALYRSPLAVALILGVGSIGLLRYTGQLDTTRLLRASPTAPAEAVQPKPETPVPTFGAKPQAPAVATPSIPNGVPQPAPTPPSTPGQDWSQLTAPPTAPTPNQPGR